MIFLGAEYEHGRTLHTDLPSVEEPANFSTTPTCSDCGTPYVYDSSKESEIIEVEVKAYKRIIIRETLKKGCSCKGVPTIRLSGLNCRHWLRSYLTACADNYSQPPEDLSPFLPWRMDEKRRKQLANPLDTS